MLLVGNLLNVALELLLVYVLHLGIAGSAWATVIAQSVMAAGFMFAIAPMSTPASWRPTLCATVHGRASLE